MRVKPNFWSLTPVITAAWPWMSMSGVTRISTRCGRAGLAGQIGDLHERVDDDAADADGGGVGQFVDGFRVAVHDDARRIDAAGQSAVASSPPELTSRPAPSWQPIGRRRSSAATLRHRRISTLRQRRRGNAAAVPEVGFVENVCRGAELVGDVGQRHIAHTEPAQVVDGCVVNGQIAGSIRGAAAWCKDGR